MFIRKILAVFVVLLILVAAALASVFMSWIVYIWLVPGVGAWMGTLYMFVSGTAALVLGYSGGCLVNCLLSEG